MWKRPQNSRSQVGDMKWV